MLLTAAALVIFGIVYTTLYVNMLCCLDNFIYGDKYFLLSPFFMKYDKAITAVYFILLYFGVVGILHLMQ